MMINSISDAGFTPTLPNSQANSLVTAPAGEQDPAAQASSVKQAEASSGPNLQKEQEHSRQDSAAKQQQQADLKVISELAARDREVRAHEQAHASVGGAFAGAPRYSFERGPNGVSYAVGGEVSISTSAISGDPEATIRKADTVRRAALAPANPSAQDRSVAAQATQMKIQAQVELTRQGQEGDAIATEKPDQTGQASGIESAAADTIVESEQTGLQDLLQRNLMTRQALEQTNDFAQTVDQLL